VASTEQVYKLVSSPKKVEDYKNSKKNVKKRRIDPILFVSTNINQSSIITKDPASTLGFSQESTQVQQKNSSDITGPTRSYGEKFDFEITRSPMRKKPGLKSALNEATLKSPSEKASSCKYFNSFGVKLATSGQQSSLPPFEGADEIEYVPMKFFIDETECEMMIQPNEECNFDALNGEVPSEAISAESMNATENEYPTCGKAQTCDSTDYVDVALTLIESTDIFRELSFSQNVSSVKDLIDNLQSTFAGHLLIFVTSILSLIIESSPAIHNNEKFSYFPNLFMKLVRNVHMLENIQDKTTAKSKNIESVDTSCSCAKNKSVTFASDFCGASVSPPNERLVNSWRPMLHLLRRLNCVMDTINSMMDISYECFEDFHSFSDALMEFYSDKTIAKRVINNVLHHYSFDLLSSVNPKHILELADLIVLDLFVALSSNSTTINPALRVESSLKRRISWIATSVIRANIRYLYDDYYPKISADALYNYELTRSGFFNLIQIRMPQVPLLKKFSTSHNDINSKNTVHNIDRPDGWIDLSDVCLSTLIAQALRQYDLINDDFVHDFTNFFYIADILRKTELSQIVVAAEGARNFLNSVCSLSCSSTLKYREVWDVIQEMSSMLNHHGMPDDCHWSKCGDINTLSNQLKAELNPKLMLQECCMHLTALELSGLQHPLALPTLDKKQRGRKNRSFLSQISNEIYADLRELVLNCDYIFDFPILSEDSLDDGL
jgi:hypothetical protein